MAVGLDWLADNWRWAAKHGEEALAEMVDRADAVAATWRADGGATLSTHMKRSLRWWAHKRWAKDARRRERHPSLTDCLTGEDAALARVVDPAARQLVYEMMVALPSELAAVLWMRGAEGMLFDEIGEVLGVSKGTARLRWIDACVAARQVSGEEWPPT